MDQSTRLRDEALRHYEAAQGRVLDDLSQAHRRTFNQYVTRFLETPLDIAERSLRLSDQVVLARRWWGRLVADHYGVTLLFDHTVVSIERWAEDALRAIADCARCGEQVVVDPPAASLTALGEAVKRDRPLDHDDCFGTDLRR